MSTFDKNYFFKQGEIFEKKDIMQFIREYWKEDHILGNNEMFFEYEHCVDKKINFFLAINKKNNKIAGIQGFIPYSSNKNPHICGVITKVSPLEKTPLLGIEIMRRMLDFTQPSTYCGIGTNPKTMVPLVKRFFKRSVGVMDQFYMINPRINEFQIIKNLDHKKGQSKLKEKKNRPIVNLATKEFITKNFKNIFANDQMPKKSLAYLSKRYFEHPLYKYKTFSIEENNKISLLILREVSIKKSTALRVIDFIGNVRLFLKLNEWFHELMTKNNYEYIDILCSGLDEKMLMQSGFTKLDNDGDMIIPNYFEPFVQKNVKVHYEKSNENLIIFKGDADGDRPSKWKT